MNYQELRQQKIEELETKLRNNEHVKIWNVYPYRFELRDRLVDDERASDYLRECVDLINETL
tara:strand:+ start:6095 stop:6280 length:186 start_codon:yes stop_codon:yes gene_type:complete